MLDDERCLHARLLQRRHVAPQKEPSIVTGSEWDAPDAEQYSHAIRAIGGLTTAESALIRALYSARDQTATATELAEILGYSDIIPVNGTMGRLGHRIADHLPSRPARWWRAVATGEQKRNGFRWTLRPQLAAALVEQGLLDRDPAESDPRSNEPTADRELLEQRTRHLLRQSEWEMPRGQEHPTRVEVRGRRYEFVRDPQVRAHTLRRAAGSCECCGKPAPFMTDRGEPYLEVHHVQTLADGGADTPDNTAAVCPTCHRRLHLGADAEDLRLRLRERLRAMVSVPTRASRRAGRRR